MAVGFIALFQRLGLFECTLPAISVSVAIICAAATIFESLPINYWLDDNLSVPVLAALLVCVYLLPPQSPPTPPHLQSHSFLLKVHNL